MARLARWRLVLAAAMVLAMISSPGARAQDAGTVTAANPEAAAVPIDTLPPSDPTAPTATEAAAPTATSASPLATEAATTPPAATETAPTPGVTEAATTSTPASTPPTTPTPTSIVTQPATVTTTTPVPASTDVSATTSTPTAAPSTAQVASESSATVLQEAPSPQSSLRGSEAESSSASASSVSSSSKSASETTTGTLDGSSSSKTVVICLLGGVGLAIIMGLLFVVWRSRRREDPDLGTPIPPDTPTSTFPAVSMPSVAPHSAQDMSAWKASGASFASRDLPLTESIRAKLNATTRSSTEYYLANRPSHIASLPARGAQTPQANRETNASSEQSFSIRGYSEFSVHHAGDAEASAATNGRYSTNDGYSTSDRYSTDDRYSTSSRLSSDPGRSNSGWFQRQVPKSLDMHRFSSTSSTASSVVTRKNNPVSFINHDLTQTPSTEAPVTTDSASSRTDVPDWYSVIESPTDNDRYTTSSLDSDNISGERESFEL